MANGVIGAAFLALYIVLMMGMLALLKVPRRAWAPIIILPPVILGIAAIAWAAAFGWWGAGMVLILLLFGGGMFWIINRVK